ncbi:MAG: hypothetical protein WCE30_01940 [Mycobacterium sp.]
MRRSTIFACLAIAAYLAAVYLAVFIVAPASLAVADFVATTGVAIPHPSGWNMTLFDNAGSPALHITVTGLLALTGYGAVIAGCAFYFGEHEDVRSQLEQASVPETGRRASSSASPASRNTPMMEGDGPYGQ